MQKSCQTHKISTLHFHSVVNFEYCNNTQTSFFDKKTFFSDEKVDFLNNFINNKKNPTESSVGFYDIFSSTIIFGLSRAKAQRK